MVAFWERWFRTQKQQRASFTLLDYAENYLVVFELAGHEERTQHAMQLFNAANRTAQHAGAEDFLSLIKKSDVIALGAAAVYSRELFDDTATASTDRYWLSAYALR